MWGREPVFRLNGDALAWLEATQISAGLRTRLTAALPWDTVLTAADLTSKKPQIGIPVAEYMNVLGAKTKRAIAEGEFLQIIDIQK